MSTVDGQGPVGISNLPDTNVANLIRPVFTTSRLLEFCSVKELTAQTGHGPDEWRLVIVKELVDNALDACEEHGIAPEITIGIEADSLTVVDNGPGLQAEAITKIKRPQDDPSDVVCARR
jgi:signal transduction histidine kinase